MIMSLRVNFLPQRVAAVQCPGNYLHSTYTNFEKIPYKIKLDEVMNVVTFAKTKGAHENFSRQDRCNALSNEVPSQVEAGCRVLGLTHRKQIKVVLVCQQYKVKHKWQAK